MVAGGELGELSPTIPGYYPCSKGDGPPKRKPANKENAGAQRAGRTPNKYGDENVHADRAGKRARRDGSAARSPLVENHARQHGPTDFSGAGFNAHRFDLLADGGRQGARRDVLTTFEDVSAQPAPAPLKSNDRSRQLRAVMAAKPVMGPPPAIAPRQTAPASVARPEALQLSGLQAPPFDWSLKSFARFSSVNSFDLCSGQRSYATGVAECADVLGQPSSSGRTAKEEWQAALLTWQCPESPLQPAAVRALGGGDALAARRRAWQDSFSSLYYDLRRGGCRCFYLVSPKGARSPFVALFGAPGVAGRPRLHALVSRSTRGLRAQLRGERERMEFAMPLAPPGAEAAVEPRIQQELSALGQTATPDSAAGDGKPASLLEFEGPQQVHAIYSWLLDSVLVAAAEAHDVPLLLAPTAFLGASCQRLASQVQPQASAHAAASEQAMFRLELRGLIPPWTFQRLCAALQRGQRAGFQVLAETEAASSNLNVAAGRAGGPGVGLGWEQPVAGLAGLATRELRCTGAGGPCYDARLAPAT